MNQEKLLEDNSKEWDTSRVDTESQSQQQKDAQNQELERRNIESNVNLNQKKQDYENNYQRQGSNTDRGDFFNSKLPFFSLELALRHAKANRVYKESIESSTMSDSLNVNPNDICPCCSNVIQSDSKLIPIWKSTFHDIAHLGPTYPMYFQFMRYSMAFITLIFLVSGIYDLAANKTGSYCQDLSDLYPDNQEKSCNVDFMQTTATSNRGRTEPDVVLSALNLVTCILMMAFSTFFRYRQIQFEKDIDKSDISVSDYTVFINKIPQSKTRQDLINFLQNQVPGIKVEKIVQAFKLKKYIDLNNQMLLAKTEEEKNLKKQEIRKYEIQCYEQDDISDTFGGAAFVSFEKEEQKVKVIEHFDFSFWKQYLGIHKVDQSKLFEGNQLTVQQAKEPGDTNWENIEFTTSQKMNRRLFTFLLTLGLLALSFWGLFAIGEGQGDLRKETNDSVKLSVVSAFSSILTVLINQVLQALIQFFSVYEAYNFKTDTVISVSKKSGIAQFINTTIVSFFVMLILNGRSIWINGGMISSVSSLAISNAFVPAAVAFVSPENIVKWIQQKIFVKLSNKKQQMVSQQFVHTMFEKPQFNPSACFAAAANSLLFAAFYSWIIPIALPFCAISLGLQYFVNKYKLLRRQSIPIPFGTDLPEEMIDFYFEIIILFYSLGCLAFEIILYKETHICTILMVIFSGVFYFAPINEYLDEKLNSSSNYVEELSYRQAKAEGHFSSDYDRENPVLKGRSIQKYVNKLIDKEENPEKKELLHSVFYIQSSKLGVSNMINSKQQDTVKEDGVVEKQGSINIEQSKNN